MVMPSDQLAGRPSPILVLGMHRSGTSAVSRLLHGAGINMGWRQESNAESHFFLRINQWVFTQCGATWATVEPLPQLLDEQGELLASAVRRRIRSPLALEHFGRSPRAQQWGVKDPRLTFLYPVYEHVFADCKMVVVSRHGVDVAESLRVRAHASRLLIKDAYVSPALGVRQPRANRLQNAIVASDRARNFELWLRYERSLHAIQDSVDASRVHRISFEDLADNTTTCLAGLSEFVGHHLTDIGIEKSRALAYRSSAELRAFADQRVSELAEFGY